MQNETQHGADDAHDTHPGHAGHAGHDMTGHETGSHEHATHDEHPGHAGHEAHDDHAVHSHGEHAGHSVAMFRDKFWWSLVLSIPVVFFSPMVAHLLGYHLPEFPGSTWIAPVLGTVIFFYGGLPFLQGAVRELKNRQPGMMTLIAMAISVAFIASWATSLGWGLDLDFWWELALLIVIMLLGHWIEMRALGAASGALDALAALLPDTAERVNGAGAGEGGAVTGSDISEVSIGDLAPGDVVLVRSGARVPADGTIVDGAAELDESMITGESAAVPRGVGDTIVAGTVATDNAIRVRVTAVGEQTALAGIQRLVAEAQASGSRAQALADRAAALLFYFAAAAGIITFIVWIILGSPDDAITRTVTVLVIACPHALGLAIPLVIAISTERAARAGVLVKDRLALERMRNIDVVLFDKTGTLTRGEHAVTDVAVVDGQQRDDLLRLAAAAEQSSEHPVARAIVAAALAAAPGTDGFGQVSDFRSATGVGVRARVDGVEYAVGGPRLLEEEHLEPPAELRATVAEWKSRGASVLYLVRAASVAQDPDAQAPDARAAVLGGLALQDEVRAESRAAITALHKRGIRVAMITGDARQVADAVGADLAIDEVFAEVLPGDKAAHVAELQGRGLRVAMVGDGVNDAPALARADVGIAIGAGTDVAVESAGVVLASSDPRAVLSIIELSHASYRKMVQNLVWAAGYNIVSVPLAAGVLAGVGFVLSPAAGAVLMSLSTIVVALNAQLLRRVSLDPARLAPAA
ncbi:ATPase [Leifsonia sp. Root4]|uniref:heavy metal translocating P-type ATPase n=1 Tax=Leifsonia sp. Root4 TaxID=1736525 RepID=UPI0006F96229|nr:heavy metal translocating P-type ATPase [Leifsonia sp. Root4]KQW04923.1 ATPase [Leifsonia sp. Root4]